MGYAKKEAWSWERPFSPAKPISEGGWTWGSSGSLHGLASWGIWAAPHTAHHIGASHSSTSVFWNNLWKKPLVFESCLTVCFRRSPSQVPFEELAPCPPLLSHIGSREVTPPQGIRKEGQTALLMGQQRCYTWGVTCTPVFVGAEESKWECFPWSRDGPWVREREPLWVWLSSDELA